MEIKDRLYIDFIIDDSKDPMARDEGWIMDNSPFQN